MYWQKYNYYSQRGTLSSKVALNIMDLIVIYIYKYTCSGM